MSDKETVTLEKATNAYLEHLAASGTKPSTVAVYQRSLQLAANFFGADRKLDSILLTQTGKYFACDALTKHPHNGKPKAMATIRQNKRVFRQMMEYAQTQGWISGQLPVPKSELQHARSSKAAGSSTKQPEAETPEPIEAEAPAEAETQN
jgi:hypothetical protein